METKTYENALVFIVLGIVMIISSEFITNIIEKTNKNSAEIQTKTLMNTVEQIYVESVIVGDSTLPFIANFIDQEMYLKTGAPSQTYLYDGKVKHAGSYPSSGEIVIINDNRIIANNIKIRNYTCNTMQDDEVICKKA